MCINPKKIIVNGEEVIVPCKKCILCKRKKCREWAIKLYHESQYHKKMCMVTLTFRTKFLFRPKWKELTKVHTKKDLKTGKITRINEKYMTIISPSYITNVKKTGWLVTLFIKKLRKKLNKINLTFSYFAVGEHGTQKTHRAHWHILFFGIGKEELDSVLIGRSKKSKDIYFSPIIDECWNYEKMGIGKHTISEVTTATIKYVANYTMKKMYKNISENKIYPTTMRFSNQQKIGIKWARRNHKELRRGYLQDQDGMKYPIPNQYYKEMLRFENDSDCQTMVYTAIIIENNKIETINKLLNKGLLSKEELLKKAKKLEYREKMTERDVEF